MNAGRPRKGIRFLAMAGALALGLTACSSGGGKPSTEDSSADGAPAAASSGLTIAMVTHEAPGDSFWDKIRAGATASAKAHGIDLKYSNDPEASGQATKIQNAVASKVDGIAVTLSKPDPLAPAVKAALDAKIPVVAFNSGIKDYKRVGLSMYFGSDEDLAGKSAGERLTKAGAKKAICVVQEQGSVALEARCAGLKSTFANTENLNVNGTDLPGVQSTLQAKLQEDPSIDYIVTLGAPFALAALDSVKNANSKAKVATFDLNADAAQAIQDGTIDFSVDQQPYVQGYEAVDSLWRQLTNGNDIGGGLPVLTGPSFVDSSNIAQILPYAKKNTR
jgi:simple sugar transport system substrate-binding protein